MLLLKMAGLLHFEGGNERLIGVLVLVNVDI